MIIQQIKYGAEVSRESKTLTISKLNPEMEGFNILNKDKYIFNLDGWTGRYGKPLEFLLSLHISTMAPDLAFHVATDKEFDTKVHIDFDDVVGHVRLQYVVNAEAVRNMKEAEQTLWDVPSLEYLEQKVAEDGTIVLSPEDLINIKNAINNTTSSENNTTYDEDIYNEDEDEYEEDDDENEETEEVEIVTVADTIGQIGINLDALKDAAAICEENGGKGKQFKTKQPYIKYAEKTWYKNVYFVIDESVRNKVDDTFLQSASDFSAYNISSSSTETSYAPYDFHPAEGSVQANIVSDGSGTFQVLETRNTPQRTQQTQPLKGSTNPRIKELFVGAGNDNIEGKNPKPEYYIYDGTVDTAKKIEELREKEAQIRASGYTREEDISKLIKQTDDSGIYRAIDFNKNSLTALTILENMKTDDADFILRDFKLLLVELKYFKESDFKDKNIGDLDWIIPDYNPADWPSRKYEKQNFEYGTYIKSKASMDAIAEQEKAEANMPENVDIDSSADGDAEEENATENTPTDGTNNNSTSNSSNNSGSTGTNTQTGTTQTSVAQTNATVESVAESGDGFTSLSEINGVSYRNYKQSAGSYASHKFWSGTIASHGCGPTSAAIVASGYGQFDATPQALADIIGGSTTLAKVSSALATFGITSTVHTVANVAQTANDIRASFNEGKPVIVLMSETRNKPSRPANQFSGDGHFIVLLGEENGTLIISNPGRGDHNIEGNRDTRGLEAFIQDYMINCVRSNRGYLIFDDVPEGGIPRSKGFEAGVDVITPGIGEVTKVSSNSITIKFTEINVVKDMTMTITGFTVDSSISVGDILEKKQKIGVTTEEDILVLLRAPNKAIIENVEDYMPAPNIGTGVAYNGDLTEDEFEFFAAVLVAENGSSEDTMAPVAHVIKNRAMDTVHFTDVNTIPEVLIASGQYGSVYKVPGSGPGPIPGVNNERAAPAGARTYIIEGKGEYWVGNNGRPREATDSSRKVAKEVLDGTREDLASEWLGKLALYQVTYKTYENSSTQGLINQHKLYYNGELYAHDWGSLTGNPDNDSCTMP